nr:putative reverse transcriptase domain-containing protein [Tanacetum cinerariifolium]
MIQAARDRQKSYTKLKRKPMDFQVGDRVMLKVLSNVGDVAYRLKLLKQLSRVHNTFHVLNLKKCLSDESLVIPLDELRIDNKLHFVEEPVEIIDREIKQLKRSRITSLRLDGTLNEVLSLLGNERINYDNPHQTLKGKGIVDSGCSRHMTGNKAYPVEYQDFNGGPVALR